MDVRSQFLQGNILQQFGMALEDREIALHSAVTFKKAGETFLRLGGMSDENFPDKVTERQGLGAEGLEFGFWNEDEFAGSNSLDRDRREAAVVVAPDVENGLTRITEPEGLLAPVGREIGTQDALLYHIKVVIEAVALNDMIVFRDFDRFHPSDEIAGYV